MEMTQSERIIIVKMDTSKAFKNNKELYCAVRAGCIGLPVRIAFVVKEAPLKPRSMTLYMGHGLLQGQSLVLTQPSDLSRRTSVSSGQRDDGAVQM